MKRSMIAVLALCALGVLLAAGAALPHVAQARVEGDCEAFDSGIKDGAKDYGVAWEDLAFVAQGDDGLTADGTAGVTVSEPAALTEDFSAPVTYSSSEFSKYEVTGAHIDATKVVTITIPEQVLNIGDDAAYALTYVNENSEDEQFRTPGPYAYYATYGQAAVNWARIQACFDYAYRAYEDGVTDTMFRVVLPKGTYEVGGIDMGECFHVYNNTWVDMTAGTKLVQLDQKVAFARSGYAAEDLSGYERRNIVLDGGTWVGLKNEAVAHSVVILGHVKNAVVRNVTFDSASNGHHLEFDGVRAAHVCGCEFKNYYGEKNKEAFQLDVTGLQSAETFPLHDYTTTRNIVIFGNDFHDLSRGLGTHYTYTGHANSEVLVKGNTFSNLRDEGVFLTAFDNVAVLGNTFTSCTRGIRATPIVQGSGHYEITGDAVKANGGYVIEGNTFCEPVSGDVEDTYAMFFYGNKIDSAVYELKNILIRDNTVSATGIGLRFSRVSGVTVSAGSYAASKGYGLLARTDSKLQVSSAALTGATAALQAESASTVTAGSCTLKSGKGPGIATDGATLTASKCAVNATASNAVRVSGGNATIDACTVAPAQGYGVYALESAKATVSNCTLSQMKKAGAYAKGATLTLKTCTLNSNGTYGAVATNGATLSCTTCSVKKNATQGISVKSGAALKATSCTVNSNGASGVYARSATLSLKSCNVKSNGRHGIDASSSTVKLNACNVNSNVLNGAALVLSVAKLTSCVFKSNKGNGVYGKKSTATLSSATVSKSALYGVYANACTLKVSKGSVASNKKSGIFAKKTALTCSKATVKSNKLAGVECAATTVAMKSCTVSKNGQHGIRASKASVFATFAKNKVLSNKGYGLYASTKTTAAGGTAKVIAKNTFKANKKGAVRGVKTQKR